MCNVFNRGQQFGVAINYQESHVEADFVNVLAVWKILQKAFRGSIQEAVLMMWQTNMQVGKNSAYAGPKPGT